MSASGTVAPMSMRVVSAMSILVLATGLTLMAACNDLKAPRFSSPAEREPVIPLSVKLVFDESVRSSILEQTVCADRLWKGRLGDAIVQSFTETGRARLTHLTVGDPSGMAQPTTAPTSEFTAFITLASASFTPTSRHGADNNYLAQFDVRLVATFQDAQGYRFPDAPMVYSSRVSLYTPQMSGSDNQCKTGQLDAAMQTAVDHLAGQLMEYLMQLREKTQGESTAGRQNPGVGPGLLALKATLLDANSNLVLEGGERIGVRIDVTNTGKATLGATTITLSGTPALIDAFAGALSAPVQIVNLQPGETKSTILWGAMPASAGGSRGELTVTVIPSSATGGAPATQTLVAAMASRGKPAAPALRPAVTHRRRTDTIQTAMLSLWDWASTEPLGRVGGTDSRSTPRKPFPCLSILSMYLKDIPCCSKTRWRPRPTSKQPSPSGSPSGSRKTRSSSSTSPDTHLPTPRPVKYF